MHSFTAHIAGLALLGHARNVLPNLSPEAALRLDFGKKLKRKKNYSMLACHWVALHLGGQSQQEEGAQVQDELEAMISILRKTDIAVQE